MGREIKRVPLDFDWPIDKTWEGFLNPHYKECPGKGTTCFGGVTAGREWFEQIVHFLMAAADNSVEKPRPGQIYPHPYLREFPLAVTAGYPSRTVIPPTKDLEELVVGLGARSRGGDPFGHGAIDRWSVQKKIMEAAGVDEETWGVCPICKGEGIDPATKEAYEAWKETPVPTGEGWQVWQTVSEGAPVSPVFATAEELIDYLVEGGDEWDRKRGEGGCSREAAESFVKGSGWVPSMVSDGCKLYEGIGSAAILSDKET